MNCSALPCLLHLLSSAKESIRKEACWTISNITAGNRAQIQVLNDTHTHCTSLPRASLAGLRLFVMLRLHPQTFKGVSLFVVSMWGLFLDLRITLILCSFCFFLHLRLQAVIDANIFPVLIEILQKAEFRTRKEAAWAITNATSGGTPEQIR